MYGKYGIIVSSTKERKDCRMAVATMKTVTARARLENGRDTSGNMTYVNQSLGNMKESAFSGNSKSASLASLIAVVGALEPCISKDVGMLELVSTELVTES